MHCSLIVDILACKNLAGASTRIRLELSEVKGVKELGNDVLKIVKSKS